MNVRWCSNGYEVKDNDNNGSQYECIGHNHFVMPQSFASINNNRFSIVMQNDASWMAASDWELIQLNINIGSITLWGKPLKYKLVQFVHTKHLDAVCTKRLSTSFHISGHKFSEFSSKSTFTYICSSIRRTCHVHVCVCVCNKICKAHCIYAFVRRFWKFIEQHRYTRETFPHLQNPDVSSVQSASEQYGPGWKWR